MYIFLMTRYYAKQAGQLFFSLDSGEPRDCMGLDSTFLLPPSGAACWYSFNVTVASVLQAADCLSHFSGKVAHPLQPPPLSCLNFTESQLSHYAPPIRLNLSSHYRYPQESQSYYAFVTNQLFPQGDGTFSGLVDHSISGDIDFPVATLSQFFVSPAAYGITTGDLLLSSSQFSTQAYFTLLSIVTLAELYIVYPTVAVAGQIYLLLLAATFIGTGVFSLGKHYLCRKKPNSNSLLNQQLLSNEPTTEYSHGETGSKEPSNVHGTKGKIERFADACYRFLCQSCSLTLSFAVAYYFIVLLSPSGLLENEAGSDLSIFSVLLDTYRQVFNIYVSKNEYRSHAALITAVHLRAYASVLSQLTTLSASSAVTVALWNALPSLRRCCTKKANSSQDIDDIPSLNAVDSIA